MASVNFVAVFAAAFVAFMVGGLWYGPLFLKTWQAEAGITEEKMRERSPVLVFGLAFLLNLAASFGLGHVFATYGQPSLGLSLVIAGGIALAFIATAFGINYLFAARSLRLFAIDAGYWLVTYSLMGVVHWSLA